PTPAPLVGGAGRGGALPGAAPTPGPRAPTPIGTDSAVRASAIYAGLTAEPTRQDYLGRHRPLEDRDELLPAIRACEDAEVRAMIADRLPTHHRAVTRAVFRATRSDVPPDDDTAARLLVGLRSFAVRDAVWLAVDDATLDGCQLWLDLARRAPAPYDAAPWFLLAWASWRAGRSVLARDAVERALGSDPGYSAADLLLAAIEHHLDPRRMPMLRQPSK
ncbi:MAG: DUF4192 domain-containing protein, partial [Jatrophihabitans sp.]|uniref:DUF4192 domain-containing protein n=1 Tax=Jatrophihabitans sp. TaxID=1932789 RepID=UPI003F7E2771